MANIEQLEKTAAYLSEADVKVIQEFVDANIINDNSMTGKEIYAALKGRLPEMPEGTFGSALSCNVRGGYIVGILGKRRVGYVPCERAEPKEKPKTKPPMRRKRRGRPPKTFSILNDKTPESPGVQTSDLPNNLIPLKQKPEVFTNTTNWVWVGKSRYKLSGSRFKLLTFLETVLQAKESENGTVIIWHPVFNSDGSTTYKVRRFDVDVEVVKRYLRSMLNAPNPTEAEPLLETTDKNGVPLVFVEEVYKDPRPETLAAWNERAN